MEKLPEHKLVEHLGLDPQQLRRDAESIERRRFREYKHDQGPLEMLTVEELWEATGRMFDHPG